MTVPATENLVAKLASAFAALPEVELAYLFGSWAAGRARPDSDIDVAVLVSAAAARDCRGELARLFSAVGRVVPSERLDIVLLNDAPSLLRHRIVSHGRLLLARTPEVRVRFVERTIRDYQDMQVRRTFFYRQRVQRIREGKWNGRSGDILAQARRVAQILGNAAVLPNDD